MPHKFASWEWASFELTFEYCVFKIFGPELHKYVQKKLIPRITVESMTTFTGFAKEIHLAEKSSKIVPEEFNVPEKDVQDMHKEVMNYIESYIDFTNATIPNDQEIQKLRNFYRKYCKPNEEEVFDSEYDSENRSLNTFNPLCCLFVGQDLGFLDEPIVMPCDDIQIIKLNQKLVKTPKYVCYEMYGQVESDDFKNGIMVEPEIKERVDEFINIVKASLSDDNNVIENQGAHTTIDYFMTGLNSGFDSLLNAFLDDEVSNGSFVDPFSDDDEQAVEDINFIDDTTPSRKSQPRKIIKRQVTSQQEASNGSFFDPFSDNYEAAEDINFPRRKFPPRKLTEIYGTKRQVTTQQEVSKIEQPIVTDNDTTDVLTKLCQDLQLSDQVRVGVKEDGKLFVAVYDFINFVTGREQFDHYSWKYWKRLTSNSSQHSEELDMLSFLHKFGKKNTPCIHITGIFFIYFHLFLYIIFSFNIFSINDTNF